MLVSFLVKRCCRFEALKYLAQSQGLSSGVQVFQKVGTLCFFVYFFFILGPPSEENLSIPILFHMAQYFLYNMFSHLLLSTSNLLKMILSLTSYTQIMFMIHCSNQLYILGSRLPSSADFQTKAVNWSNYDQAIRQDDESLSGKILVYFITILQQMMLFTEILSLIFECLVKMNKRHLDTIIGSFGINWNNCFLFFCFFCF